MRAALGGLLVALVLHTSAHAQSAAAASGPSPGQALSQATTAAPGRALAQAQSASPDPALEARVMKLAAELRCLVCQNQTIADSNADLAVDLRNQVREMLRGGANETQVTDYMTQRYGDFVLYRPPVKSTTALLWFGPAGLLAVAVTVLLLVIRRRQRLPQDRFEPDPQ